MEEKTEECRGCELGEGVGVGLNWVVGDGDDYNNGVCMGKNGRLGS